LRAAGGAAAAARAPRARRSPLSTGGCSPSPSRRYSTFVGIAFLVLIAIATLNTIRTGSGGTLGVGEGDRGMPLPEFAVPNAVTGPLNKDANIFQDNCSTSQNPCPKSAGRTPACRIPAKEAIRACAL